MRNSRARSGGIMREDAMSRRDKSVRAGAMAMLALDTGVCSGVKLHQVYKADHARRLKGEDAQQEPICDGLHGDKVSPQCATI